MADKTDIDEFLSSINSHRNRGVDYFTLLPPEDCYISDVGSSSDDEEVDTNVLDSNNPEIHPPHVPIDQSNDFDSTVRSNRLQGGTLEQDKSLLKKGRGTFDYKVDNNAGIAVVKWADTNCVTLASSYVSHTPTFQVKRYSKEGKKKVDVVCPQIMKQYNTHMGGVDLADMLIALYKTPYKLRRWYLGIFGQLIDICVNNAWLLRRRDSEVLGRKYDHLKEFRVSLALSLLKTEEKTKFRKSDFENDQPAKKIRVPVMARPTDDIRYDQIGHFPTFTQKGRCRLCTNGQTTVFCQKCNVRLCFVQGQNTRNCFLIYHVKDA
ncbi:piggyBac transposable element-derived protein 2-like [Anthonomus grandis grandis]|uniref:piggyBac transposable element-derived protein 2-like n=1 Tax=Anthonomus grandis grandis TaxID=2921223 RepID=UPI002165CB39|nr:piggyBac transposable element-derived protein 2-like [Anthonomus grandis grandis]